MNPSARASSDPLLQPFQLKHLILRNRLMSTAHEPAYSEGGMPKDRYRLYHREKARGGLALTMTAGSAVIAEDSPASFGNLHAYKDEIVPWLRRLTDDCHEEGCAVMIQVTHLGRRTSWASGDWLPVLAPSPIREPAHRAFPKEAEDWDLERIVTQYADTAERMLAAGLDGIEIEAYGHLMDGFWSPATNRRTDDYGGSLDNRLRFTWEVLGAIRKRVGAEFIVGLRLVADEAWDKGLSRTEGMEIARRLAASGQVDFLNVIRGHIDTDEALSHVIPGMGSPSAPHLDFAGEVRAAAKIPVFHAARIQDVATARHAVASGKLDMVGMTRAHIADPHIGRKIAEGRENEIRPCIGMGYCIDRIYFGGDALCIHNAATGREASMPHVIARSTGPKRRAVVIGAGPAGLEAARVLAARGHGVLVYEAADEPGGQVRVAAGLRRRREILGLVDWRMEECARDGVEFRFNAYAEAAEVLAEAPDLVIVATGGLPNTDFLETGADLAVTGWDILSGAARPAESVIFYDDNGGHTGMTAAEFIAGAGSALEIVTPERTLAPDLGGTGYPVYFRAFSAAGARVTLNLRLEGLERAGNQILARFRDEYGGGIVEKRAAQVVVDHGTLPLEDLYFALKPLSRNLGAVDYPALIAGREQALVRGPEGGFQLFRIGDAVSSRNIHAAIYDALRLTHVM